MLCTCVGRVFIVCRDGGRMDYSTQPDVKHADTACIYFQPKFTPHPLIVLLVTLVTLVNPPPPPHPAPHISPTL
jgi:hypothetical protein